jgi:UDP-glucose 4-epimerase
MRVLVTGGAGFIGSHIVDALIGQGHDVVVVDDLSSGKRANVSPEARFYEVSITDPESLDRIFAEERPELVNHHAAQTSVRHSMTEPSKDAGINIIGSINLLQSCVKYGATRLIFASTCAVYSEPRHVPMEEAHPTHPQSAYGMAKYAVEGYIRFYSDVYGLRYKIFRYGNVFGPRQNPSAEAGVVAIFTGQLLAGTQPTIFGDGTKTRDYVSVKDVVAANLLAMGDVGDGEVFNIARGVEVSDFEIFDAVRTATQVGIEPAYADKRPGEVDRVALDCSKVEKRLGWLPAVQLDEGVQRVVEYSLQT